MPRWAISNLPRVRALAPVNAPFSWPNSSDSIRLAGIAAQLSARKGKSRRGELKWIARATSSLPTPLSPKMSTVARSGATRRIRSRTARIAGEWLTRFLTP